MNFKEFRERMKAETSQKTGAEVFLKEIPKNNGVSLWGLFVREEGVNVSPAVYLNSYFEAYQKGADIEEIIEKISREIYAHHIENPVDLSGFPNYELAQRQIVFRLVNYEKNREMLEEMPHRRFLDLAVTYYYLVLEKPFFGKGAVQIHNSHMETWGTTEEELYKKAMENTPALLPCIIKSMDSCMEELLEEEIASIHTGKDGMEKLCLQCILEEFKSNPTYRLSMYVMTNQDILMGAACMLYPGNIRAFARKMHSDLYILPSSLHEVIIIPAKGQTGQEELRQIVWSVNREQVDVMEQLSDSVYIYRRETDTIEIA